MFVKIGYTLGVTGKTVGPMWRDGDQRAQSARARLALARELWTWRPHPAQMRFFCDSAQVRVAACGRRWGKTEALSIDIASLALTEPACRQLVVAPTEAQARLLGEAAWARLRAAWDWRDRHGQPHRLVAGRTLTARQRPGLSLGLTGPSEDTAREESSAREEGAILFRTAGRDGRGLRGLWAHRIVADEAGRIPDTVLTDVLLPMLADVGGEYVLASSPAGRRSAYFRLFAKGMDGDAGAEITYASFQCPTSDNPHIQHAFLSAQREELGESMYAQEFGAAFVEDFGAVFRDEDIDAAITSWPDVVLENGQIGSLPVPGRLYTLGIDWGRKVDFTVAAILDATHRPARLVFLQRWQGTGWETQAHEVAQIAARFQPWRILADGSSIGDPLAETLQTQIRLALAPGARRTPTVERFTFGAESKTRLIDRLTLGLSARAVQYPPHRVLLSELRAFEYGDTGPSGRAKMGARTGAHDDTVIALALAWWAAPEADPLPLKDRLLLGSQLG